MRTNDRRWAALFAMPVLAISTLTAQVQVDLEAVQPLTISVGGAVVQQHPAGPLAGAQLSHNDPSCGGVGFLSCSLTGNVLSSRQDVSSFTCGAIATDSDLRLALLSAQAGWATLRCEIRSDGDGFLNLGIDISDDGSLEFEGYFGSSLRRTLSFLVPIGPSPLLVRIKQVTSTPHVSGQSLTLAVDDWSPTATPEQDGCGGLFASSPWPTSAAAWCDHTLMLADSDAPNVFGVLKAGGYGQFHTFLVATNSATLPLQLPQPFAETCPTLGSVIASASGVAGTPVGVQDMHELTIPTLPPGLTFFVQHASANVFQPPQFSMLTKFDTSNVVRIDT